MLGAPEVRWPKLLLVSIISIAFIVLQTFLHRNFGWSFDFVLVLLVTSAFFLGLLELFFLILLSSAVLFWQPLPSWEMLLVFALPLLVYGARKIFSWESWTSSIIWSVAAVTVFYLPLGMGIFLDNWLLMVNNILGSAIFAVIAFFLLEYLYE